ncbi:lysophospholipid acyltransferase family protein [Acidicapsa ligni]|uniref:lysophospholipid acyltransferase family protein n=1 Tax=Acidicapsa ligni TaxID=542300 RepID=UPI0021E05780|nr:lysophospholipid acyltransferase family protein [Acidicapsa ligni]
MISSLLLLATFVVLGVPVAAVCIPWFLITRNLMPLYRSSMFIVRLAFRIAGIRIHITGLENIPAATACIFMSNHVSNLDPPVLLPLIPGRTSVFLKRSLMSIPILGYAMRLAEFIPVDRDRTVESAQEGVRLARQVLMKGIHITTFVEGTRSRDGRLLPFKKGPFYLAMESGAPCIPISIWGTETMMSKGSLRIHRGTAHVVFHAPIYPANVASANIADRAVLMEAVRAAISSGLPEEMRA